MANTKLSIEEIEVALAKNRYFDWRRNIVVYNITGIGSSVPVDHECDMLIISKSGYVTEIEINRNWSDFLNEFKKNHRHKSCGVIKNFLYCIPVSLLEKVKDKLDKENVSYTGIITYDENLRIRVYSYNKSIDARKLTI